MFTLCIKELVAAMGGGELRLGNMPPLGGELEPVGHVVAASATVKPGDIVVLESHRAAATPRRHGVDGDWFAEEAFANGALGVISEQRAMPWDGRFCLRVPSIDAALWEWVSSLRARRHSPLVVMIGEHPQFQQAATEVNPKEDTNGFDDQVALVWRFITAMRHNEAAFVAVNRFEFLHIVWQKCRPDAVVLGGDIPEFVLDQALRSMSPPATLVAEEVTAELQQLALRHHLSWRSVRTFTPVTLRSLAGELARASKGCRARSA